MTTTEQEQILSLQKCGVDTAVELFKQLEAAAKQEATGLSHERITVLSAAIQRLGSIK